MLTGAGGRRGHGASVVAVVASGPRTTAQQFVPHCAQLLLAPRFPSRVSPMSTRLRRHCLPAPGDVTLYFIGSVYFSFVFHLNFLFDSM